MSKPLSCSWSGFFPAVLKGAVEVSAGKAPVIVGVSEFTTATAANFARDAEALGATGLMVLPAMVYVYTIGTDGIP